MRLHPVLSAALLALVVSGCFTSAADFITPADADYPVADGTRLAVHQLDENGARGDASPDIALVTRDGDRYTMTMGDDGKPFTGLMKEIGPNLFAVSAREADTSEGNLYVLLERTGDTWQRWSMICPDFAALAEARGVALSDFGVTVANSDCVVADFDGLKRALLFAHEFGKPDAEYVRE